MDKKTYKIAFSKRSMLQDFCREYNQLVLTKAGYIVHVACTAEQMAEIKSSNYINYFCFVDQLKLE
jgi:hypothetical protein